MFSPKTVPVSTIVCTSRHDVCTTSCGHIGPGQCTVYEEDMSAGCTHNGTVLKGVMTGLVKGGRGKISSFPMYKQGAILHMQTPKSWNRSRHNHIRCDVKQMSNVQSV